MTEEKTNYFGGKDSKITKWHISNRYQKEIGKGKHGTLTKGSDEIKVMYTNIDGILPRKLELTDYLREEKNIYLEETKHEDNQTNIENYNHNIWRQDRKDKKEGWCDNNTIIQDKSVKWKR